MCTTAESTSKGRNVESVSASAPVEGNVVQDLLMPLTGKSRARVPDIDKGAAEVVAAAFVLVVFVDDETLVDVVLAVDDVFVDTLVVEVAVDAAEVDAAEVDALTTFMVAFEEVAVVVTARAGQALRRTGRAEANARRHARKKR